MADQKAPFVDPKVVAWLNTQFPDKCPRPTDTKREIWMSVGARRVVTHLSALAKDQSENP